MFLKGLPWGHRKECRKGWKGACLAADISKQISAKKAACKMLTVKSAYITQQSPTIIQALVSKGERCVTKSSS